MAARIAEKVEIPYNLALAAGATNLWRAADADREAARQTAEAVMTQQIFSEITQVR